VVQGDLGDCLYVVESGVSRYHVCACAHVSFVKAWAVLIRAVDGYCVGGSVAGCWQVISTCS